MADTESLLAVLRAACAEVELDGRDAVPLRQHANAVFLLPSQQVVVRLSPITMTWRVPRGR